MPEVGPFGRRVAETRKMRELTQEELAQKAGIPAAVISHFETGVRSSASADNLIKLADSLGVTIDYLLGRTDEMTPNGGEFDKLASQMPDDSREIVRDFLQAALARSKRPDTGAGA